MTVRRATTNVVKHLVKHLVELARLTELAERVHGYQCSDRLRRRAMRGGWADGRGAGHVEIRQDDTSIPMNNPRSR